MIIKKDEIVPAEYREESKKLVDAWGPYVKSLETVRSSVTKMIDILESAGYNRTRAIEKIVKDHKHLKGFSRANVYRQLPDDVKRGYESDYTNMLPMDSDVSNETFEILPGNDPYEKIAQKLDSKVVKLARKIELSPNKLKMLDNVVLNKHPQLQKNMVDKIAPLSTKDAKLEVAQKVRDIETGAVFKSEGEYYLNEFNREKISKKPDRVKHPIEYAFDINHKINQLMELTTGHKLTGDEIGYDPNHITSTQKHRFEILHNMEERQMLLFEKDLELLREMIDSFLWEINEVLVPGSSKEHFEGK